MFGDVTPKVRDRVAGEVQSVGLHFGKEFKKYPLAAAIARVVLKDEALAKSHRPSKLFDDAQCPIVGVSSFGELLVSVRPATLDDLEESIRTEATKEGIANISTIKTIEPFQIEPGQLAVLKKDLATARNKAVKIRLFRHHDPKTDNAVQAAFLAELERLRIEPTSLNYASSVVVYKLEGVHPDHIAALANFVGTQSLGSFPDYRAAESAMCAAADAARDASTEL